MHICDFCMFRGFGEAHGYGVCYKCCHEPVSESKSTNSKVSNSKVNNSKVSYLAISTSKAKRLMELANLGEAAKRAFLEGLKVGKHINDENEESYTDGRLQCVASTAEELVELIGVSEKRRGCK